MIIPRTIYAAKRINAVHLFQNLKQMIIKKARPFGAGFCQSLWLTHALIVHELNYRHSVQTDRSLSDVPVFLLIYFN